MTSEAPYLHCRLCGVRYRSDQVIDHERQCTYQTSNSRSSSRNSGEDEIAPIPSRDSWVNQFRDSQEYYAQAAKSSQSDQLKDPKSNEESIDSPLNLTNRGGSARGQEISDQLTENPGRPVTRNQKNPSPAESVGAGSTENYDPPTKRPEPTSWEIPSTDGQDVAGSGKAHDQPTESQDRSSPTPLGPNRAGADSKDQPVENRGASKSGSWVIPFPEQNRSPPTLSSSSSERKTVHHQRSHSKNKIPLNDKGKTSPQSSKEEQKREMARTPYPSEEDIKIPDAEVVEAADVLEHLPELSKHEEQAFQKHQRSLVPCSHCERTFRPDRLPTHERSCIERPKAREYITPKDKGEK